jgi:hypothetical protein
MHIPKQFGKTFSPQPLTGLGVAKTKQQTQYLLTKIIAL